MKAFKYIQEQDPALFELLRLEHRRQAEGLELIPSENIVSKATLEAMGSILTNKYSEGYPHARYYGGNEVIDEVEDLARERAKQLFKVPHVNVQPYSGSPANLSVYTAVCDPGDTVLGQSLPEGGHLTHGWKASATSMFYNAVQYGVTLEGLIDLAEVESLAKKYKPKLIWVGATAYPRMLPFKEFARIADSIGAYLAADIAHVAGLVAGGVHGSPVDYVHIVTTTTHKTLRGPRGGIVMVTQKGIKKDAELAKKIDRAVFPGLQGGPHNHTTAGVAVALQEASTPAFRKYAKQIVINAQALAKQLTKEGLEVVSGGTDNHLILLKVGAGRGAIMELALDAIGLTTNKNTIPAEPVSPFFPSGVRLGTPSVTTRGMKVREMQQIGRWIAKVYQLTLDMQLPEGAAADRRMYLASLREVFAKHPELKKMRKEVHALCKQFPIPGSFA